MYVETFVAELGGTLDDSIARCGNDDGGALPCQESRSSETYP